MNETARILCAISADKPMEFCDLLKALDRLSDGELIATLRTLEQQGLIITEGACSPITFLQLTPLGAERAREALTGQDRCPECVAAKEKRAERL
jgi:DNA-binding HxlR family transcriptional regulator